MSAKAFLCLFAGARLAAARGLTRCRQASLASADRDPFGARVSRGERAMARAALPFPVHRRAHLAAHPSDAQSILKIIVFGEHEALARAVVREYGAMAAAHGVEGVVVLRECWEFEDRVVFVLERLREDLRQLLTRAPPWLTAERKTEIFTAVLRAVARLHALRIAHGDIKPRNIMCADAFCHRPKLIDFGLAAVEGDHRPVGTFKYNPPELYPKSRRGRQSRAGDVWMLGATAADMINRDALHYLFRYEARYKADDSFDFDERVHRGFMRAVSRGLCRVRPSARALIMRWMAFAPGERPRVDAMLADVAAIGSRLFEICI